MIQATDLRIGNWVQAPLGEWMQVKQLGHKDNPDYIFAEGPQGFGTNGFEGIPLSPDILEKCGAIKQDDIHWMLTIGASVRMKFRFYTPHIYSELSDIYLGDHIRYLHTLQNLIHDLTGQELTLNL